MQLHSVLVTGANRGIGLEFVRQLVVSPDAPKHVFATYRSSDGLKQLEDIRTAQTTKSTLHLLKVDVTQKRELEGARAVVEEVVGDAGLTLLINNAGLLNMQSFPDIAEENLNLHFAVNTVAPIIAFQVMLPLLEKAADATPGDGMSFSRAGVLNISALLGSMTNSGTINPIESLVPAYKISKAALNMAMKIAAEKVKDQHILVVNMCPGWVKTDMGTDRAELTPEESVSQMLKTIATMNEDNHGSFVDRNGIVYPY